MRDLCVGLRQHVLGSRFIDMSESGSQITVHAEKCPRVWSQRDIRGLPLPGICSLFEGNGNKNALRKIKRCIALNEATVPSRGPYRLPADVDPEQSKASYSNGVLRVKLLIKVDEKRPKKVQISVE